MPSDPQLVWDHWHIEPSSICALRCPRCPRTEVPESLLNRQLSLEFFQQQIGSEVVERIRKITFCGNDGDPIYCRDLVEICRWLKSTQPNIHLVIVTNGSHRTESWWHELAAVLDHRDEIHWSIDGWDQASNEQYRVRSDWHTIMQGMRSFTAANSTAYRVWASIAFRFNQHDLARISNLAHVSNMDEWQLTKSTKFGSHYPDIYGVDDALCPDQPGLVSTGDRFQREYTHFTSRQRPSHGMKELFWQRAQKLSQEGQYSGICFVGNKGVFLNSRGEFFPCCWTANRYAHNSSWHELAQSRFNLHHRRFQEVLQDPFWTQQFMQFDSLECRTKCGSEKLKDREHVTEW
jgi:MoaA/NifB/PqqE/SkfB family radical SAM enzyme